MPLGRTDLRLVLAIGEAGTLLGGARTIGIDHSTAFRRLNALEKRLGVRLFERARDGYVPTAAGEAAIAAAGRMEEEIVGLERKLAGADLRPSGVVRVTLTDTGVDLLTPVFAAFRAAHPQIALEVAVANQFFSLSRRDADVAIRPSAEAPEDLIAHRIAEVATALYAAPSYLASRGRRALGEHAWLGPDESLMHLGSSRWLRKEIAPEQMVYRANSLVALQAAARAGLGVVPLPCYIGDRDPALVRVRGPVPDMAATMWVLIHPDLRRAARIRVFVDFIVQELTRQRALIEGRSPRKEAAAVRRS
ncbi:MAG: LysR family transcriptional regulator [Betaproteobacteria bacterium]|nr:LysR family transcriptional regulator [Betaproteobacteria bacterium]